MENKKEELIINNDYMNWLFRFTEVYPRFLDDAWRYQSDKISSIDRENVAKLHVLFEIIKEYADKNYIDAKGGENDEYYTIKCNSYGYDIGKISHKSEEVFVCQRTFLIDDYIDFNDILMQKKDEKTYQIDDEIESIKDNISNLYNMGLSHKMLWKYLSSIMNELKQDKRLIKRK